MREPVPEADPPGAASTAALAGHPIHPMFVPFPLAFLFGVLVTDLVQIWTREAFWAQMSFWLLVAGLATGVLAALFGFIDFATIRRVRVLAAGWIHFIGNATVLLLALVNLLLRWGSPGDAVGGWEITLSAAVAILLSITGWYGGELSYRHLIGVSRAGERP